MLPVDINVFAITRAIRKLIKKKKILRALCFVESMASGADLMSEGIVDSIWAAEAVAQAEADARKSS